MPAGNLYGAAYVCPGNIKPGFITVASLALRSDNKTIILTKGFFTFHSKRDSLCELSW